MGDHRREGVGRSANVARTVGHGIWVLLPILSYSFLAWLPATQAAWRARTAGWLITSAALVLAGAGVVTGLALDADGAGFGGLIILSALGGTVAAANGRRIVFAPAPEVTVDPAVQAVVDARIRREEARAIVESDTEMAVELNIGRPDLARDYDDGGLVDLNHVPPDVLHRILDWPSEVAEAFVAEREARAGYTDLTEAMALSSVGVTWLERDAPRIVLIPRHPSR